MSLVQTDQRIVFHNSKAVRFSNSGGGEKAPAGRKKSSASQTRWELKDKEVQVAGLFSNWWRQKPDFLNLGAQVLPKDLDSGDGDEWTDWRGQPTVNNGTQVAFQTKKNVKMISNTLT